MFDKLYTLINSNTATDNSIGQGNHLLFLKSTKSKKTINESFETNNEKDKIADYKNLDEKLDYGSLNNESEINENPINKFESNVYNENDDDNDYENDDDDDYENDDDNDYENDDDNDDKIQEGYVINNFTESSIISKYDITDSNITYLLILVLAIVIVFSYMSVRKTNKM